jgi:hypothetical protein
MKTTALFVEQVIIGLLILAVAGVPFFSLELICRFSSVMHQFTQLSFVVVAAYLLGIIGDRAADTLTDPLKHHYKKKVDDITHLPLKYDSGWVKTGLQIASGIDGDWLVYLRSRIRLARSMAVYLPFLTLAALLNASDFASHNPYLIKIIFLLSALGLLLLMLIVTVRRTDYKKYKHGFEHKQTIPVLWYWTILVLICLCLTPFVPVPPFIVLFFVGAAASAISFWAWLRISHTQDLFLKQYYIFDSKNLFNPNRQSPHGP